MLASRTNLPPDQTSCRRVGLSVSASRARPGDRVTPQAVMATERPLCATTGSPPPARGRSRRRLQFARRRMSRTSHASDPVEDGASEPLTRMLEIGEDEDRALASSNSCFPSGAGTRFWPNLLDSRAMATPSKHPLAAGVPRPHQLSMENWRQSPGSGAQVFVSYRLVGHASSVGISTRAPSGGR